MRTIFPLENQAVYEVMWRIEQERPQMTMLYGACVLSAGYLRLQIHTDSV